MKKLWPSLFFGNYFYGLCAVTLSIEASLQQHYETNDFKFYVIVFLGTVAYYTKAYLNVEQNSIYDNQRTAWYKQNQKNIQYLQIVYLVLIIFCLYLIYKNNLETIRRLTTKEIILIITFPFVGLLYYGLENKHYNHLQLRQIGWLKPFIIGFCWAGVVTVYPILYYQNSHSQHFEMHLICFLLFIKNFMFISVLSIMFDIKDYANDFNQELKTFVVKYGLRKTIYLIIIPLTLIGLISFLVYAFTQHFGAGKIFLNLIPFFLILIVSMSLQKRKSIFYYLVIIDGLMLIKGLCGSLAMNFF